jgi:hypothetical protein
MKSKQLLIMWLIHMWVIFGSLYLVGLSVAWTTFQLALVLFPSVLLNAQTTDAKGRPIPPKKMMKVPGAIVIDVPWHSSREAWRRTAILMPIGLLFSFFVSTYGPGIGLVTWWQRLMVMLNVGIAWQMYMIYKSRQWPDEAPSEPPSDRRDPPEERTQG